MGTDQTYLLDAHHGGVHAHGVEREVVEEAGATGLLEALDALALEERKDGHLRSGNMVRIDNVVHIYNAQMNVWVEWCV